MTRNTKTQIVAQTIPELAKQFVTSKAHDGQATRWYWRGAWYVWRVSHYQIVESSVIEREVLDFLQKRQITIRTSTIRGIIDLLRLLQYCDAEVAPVWLRAVDNPDASEFFAVRNGLLHLADSSRPELMAHTPSFWGLSSAAYEYSAAESCELWKSFLVQLWGNDSEAKSILQEWFGYCLLADTSQQKILAIIGPPRSGKSTIARVLTELLGRSNVASPSIRSLSGQFGLWGMLDKSCAIIPDATLPKPCPALEELLKSISGEDAVDIHRKGMAPLTGIRLPTRLMLLANELPAFKDPSGALERRLIVLKTRRSFYEKEDIRLTNKLLEELPGILNWAIQGLNRLRGRGHFPAKGSEINSDAILEALPDRDRIQRIVITYDRPHTERAHRSERKAGRSCRRSRRRYKRKER